MLWAKHYWTPFADGLLYTWRLNTRFKHVFSQPTPEPHPQVRLKSALKGDRAIHDFLERAQGDSCNLPPALAASKLTTHSLIWAI